MTFFCNKCQPEVASDVIFGAAVVEIGLDVRVNFGYSRSNCSRDICPAHLIQVINEDEGLCNLWQ